MLLHLQIFGGRATLSRSTAICIGCLFCGSLVSFEFFDLWTIQVLHDLVGLPFLETKAKTFMRVIFIVGLIFVVFDLNEI